MVHIFFLQKWEKKQFTTYFVEFYQGKNGKASIVGTIQAQERKCNSLVKHIRKDLTKFLLKFPASVFYLEAHRLRLQARAQYPNTEKNV